MNPSYLVQLLQSLAQGGPSQQPSIPPELLQQLMLQQAGQMPGQSMAGMMGRQTPASTMPQR